MNSYMMPVRRYGPRGESRTIRVCVEPTHPRFQASLHDAVKRAMGEEDRFKLCAILSKHFPDALEREETNPILVKVGEDTYALYRERYREYDREQHKVRIRFAK